MPYENRSRDGETQLQANNNQGLPAATEARREPWNRFSRGVSLRNLPSTHLNFLDFQFPELCERDFCCLKTLDLWSFVVAALENEYKKV